MDNVSAWRLDDDGNIIDNSVMSKSAKPDSKEIKFVNGSKIYIKKNSDKVWWKTPSAEYDLTLGNTPDPLRMKNGESREPTYSFTKAANCGMYVSGLEQLSFATSGKQRVGITGGGVHMFVPIKLFDKKSKSGKLFKKVGSDGLWWNGGESGEINITEGITGFHGGAVRERLLAVNGGVETPSYSFINSAKSGMYYLDDIVGFSVDNNTVLELSDGLVNILGDIQISGESLDDVINSKISDSTQSMLAELEYEHVDAEYISVMVKAVMEKKQPELNQFVVDTVNSMNLANKGKSLSELGIDTSELTGMLKTIVLDNSIESDDIFTSSITTKSAVFNGGGSLSQLGDDLLWTCGKKKVNLTDVAKSMDEPLSFPLYAPNNQMYSFKESVNSGMNYLNDKVSISYDGDVKMSLSNEFSLNYTSIKLSSGVVGLSGNRLVSEVRGESRTYTSSVGMPVGPNTVNAGDIVGIINDGSGQIDKVVGSEWFNDVKVKCRGFTYWSSLDSRIDLHLHTSEVQDGTNRLLKLHWDCVVSGSNVVSTTAELILLCEKTTETLNQHIRIIKISSDPCRFIIAYGDYGNASSIKIKKVKVDCVKSTPVLTIESTYIYTCKMIETFDIVYDEEMDIMALVLFDSMNYNINCVLFLLNAATSEVIFEGYSRDSLFDNPTISSNRTLNSLLLPSQTIVFSYANYKTFILLSMDYMTAFEVGDTIVDTDSIDSIDLIYDYTNTVMISAERTISDTGFLQVLDIMGMQLIVVNNKKLLVPEMVPLGFGYNSQCDSFLLFYSDLTDIFAYMFENLGDSIQLGLSYPKPSSGIKFLDNIHSKCVFERDNGKLHTLDWHNDSGVISSNFNNNFGIPPGAFIGVANSRATTGEICEVVLKGQVYFDDRKLPRKFVGKRVFINSRNLSGEYPSNITTSGIGNVFLGICVSENNILLGI